jgi:hypothetical protein
MESTYGAVDDVMPERENIEAKFATIINETVRRAGKVLIPVPAVGRAQEMMLVLNSYMKNGIIKELPVYIEGMVSEATAIHTAYPEYLVRDLRDQILHKDLNPFQSDYFTIVNHPSEREQIVAGEPAVIMATSGMLEGGPAIDYFYHLADDEKNTLIFVSYQIEGTLGSRVRNGLKEVSLMRDNGKMEVIKVKMQIENIEGFSGHSDRNQLINFVKRMSPKPSRIIVGHGERKKVDSLASALSRLFRIETLTPNNLETIRLR